MTLELLAECVPDQALQGVFRSAHDLAIAAGSSETLACLKGYRAVEDAGAAYADGVWAKRRAETTVDGQDAAIYVPPAEVIEAAKSATEPAEFTARLAAGEALTEREIGKVAMHFAKTEGEPEAAWGGRFGLKWAGRIMRKLHAEDSVTKAGNGVMLAFWPSPELAQELALPGGEAPEELHVTLAYFGQLSELGTDPLPGVERAVAQFAASHGPVKATLGGIGRFPATPHSDGKGVVYLGVSGDGLQAFREELVAAVEANGLEPKKNFAWTPHMTLKYLEPGSDASMKSEPVDVSFGFIRLSIGTASKDFPLSGSRSMSQTFEVAGSIVKTDAAKHLVFGWASICTINGRAVTDTQGDQITPATIEQAGYDFCLVSRIGGEMHERPVGALVESFVVTEEKTASMVQSLKDQGIDAVMQMPFAGWWVGFKIEDEDTWARVVSGELKAFSVGGSGKREKLAA